jgi:hypothetical protein
MMSAALYQEYVHDLRRQLGIPAPKDVVRVQTRERQKK